MSLTGNVIIIVGTSNNWFYELENFNFILLILYNGWITTLHTRTNWDIDHKFNGSAPLAILDESLGADSALRDGVHTFEIKWNEG